jgi:Transcriptional regulator
MSNTNSGGRTLQTVSMAARVMSVLKENDGVGVTELAAELEISKSTAHAHLTTLVENEFVIKRDGQYELALKLFTVGQYVRDRNPLYRHGKPQVDQLASETSQYVHIVTEENGRGVNLYQVKGDTSVDGEYQTTKPPTTGPSPLYSLWKGDSRAPTRGATSGNYRNPRPSETNGKHHHEP